MCRLRDIGRAMLAARRAWRRTSSSALPSRLCLRGCVGGSANGVALDFAAPALLVAAMTGITAGDFPHRFLRADGRRTATANEGVVMDLLSRIGAASRADLARMTGLAPHSITRLVEPLLARGLLNEGSPVVAGRGKPSVKLTLNGAAAFSVGVSVMTDAVALVLLDLAGTVTAARSARLADTAIVPACSQIRQMIDTAITDAGWDRAALLGIGFGVTGYFIGDGARLNPPRLLDPWARALGRNEATKGTAASTTPTPPATLVATVRKWRRLRSASSLIGLLLPGS